MPIRSFVRARASSTSTRRPSSSGCWPKQSRAGKTRIVVDLTDAAFMDSTALGVLIGALKRLRLREGTLAVASDQPVDPADPRGHRHGPGPRGAAHRRAALAAVAESTRRARVGHGPHRVHRRRRPGRLPAGAAAAGAVAHLPPAARRAGRRQRHPALRGGRRGARADRRAPPRAAGHPAGLDRRHRRPHARVRPRVPARRPGACARAGSGSPPRCGAASRMPPIDVYRIGELHFVRDGHHRVSVARALGRDGHRRLRDRGAHELGRRRGDPRLRDLLLKSHERLFRERVPLPPARARADRVSDPWRLRRAGRGRGGLGLPRSCRTRGEFIDRPRSRAAWFDGRVRAGRRDAARGGLLGAGDRGRRLPRVSSSATGCCAPTSGATRRSRGPVSRSAR